MEAQVGEEGAHARHVGAVEGAGEDRDDMGVDRPGKGGQGGKSDEENTTGRLAKRGRYFRRFAWVLMYGGLSKVEPSPRTRGSRAFFKRPIN